MLGKMRPQVPALTGAFAKKGLAAYDGEIFLFK